MSKHVRSRGLPVDGFERSTADGGTFPLRSPATGEHLWDVPDAGTADMDAAIQSSWNAFHATGWSTDGAMRLQVVHAFRTALEEHADELVSLMATETGIPVRLRAAHVDAPVAGMLGDPQPRPGVTAVITPATAPLSVAIEDIGRVLQAGGTVVLKPAPEAASAALEVGRIALDILPRGVLNVVSTRDVDVAIGLTLDRRVDEVSFTGSPFVGERVRAAASGARKRVRADVGGPLTITAPDDGDLAAVVAAAAVSVAANAGQGCRVPASVVVPTQRYMEALQVAIETMEEITPGDPLEQDTLCGPLRSQVALGRVQRYVDLARSEGGDVVLGGRPLDRDGWWFAPTVIGGIDRGSRLVREEVLGPVLMVVPAS